MKSLRTSVSRLFFSRESSSLSNCSERYNTFNSKSSFNRRNSSIDFKRNSRYECNGNTTKFRQTSVFLLSQFNRVKQLLFPLKLSENQSFSADFRGNSS